MSATGDDIAQPGFGNSTIIVSPAASRITTCQSESVSSLYPTNPGGNACDAALGVNARRLVVPLDRRERSKLRDRGDARLLIRELRRIAQRFHGKALGTARRDRGALRSLPFLL